mmetsp:Transcript_30124/g.72805  ORF Transcript_30124/g.72805 Transcript_30124/m.72805 type:complete len:203 (+) Transcript_30124:2569-3177(+)
MPGVSVPTSSRFRTSNRCRPGRPTICSSTMILPYYEYMTTSASRSPPTDGKNKKQKKPPMKRTTAGRTPMIRTACATKTTTTRDRSGRTFRRSVRALHPSGRRSFPRTSSAGRISARSGSIGWICSICWTLYPRRIRCRLSHFSRIVYQSFPDRLEATSRNGEMIFPNAPTRRTNAPAAVAIEISSGQRLPIVPNCGPVFET